MDTKDTSSEKKTSLETKPLKSMLSSSSFSSSHLKNLELQEMEIESEDELENDFILRLTDQNLSEIPTSLAQSKGDRVRILLLTNNCLRSLANLQYFKQLEILQLDQNGMLNIDDIPKLPYLHTLWLNNNEISDIQKLLRILAKNCPKLSHLSLLHNPICPSIYFKHGSENKYRRYRYTVLHHLNGLMYLDISEVTEKEQKDALEKGKFLEVKRPPPQQMEETGEINNNESEMKPKVVKPAAFLGKGQVKYDGRESEGNRFISNTDL